MDENYDKEKTEPIRLSEVSVNFSFSNYNERLSFLDRLMEESIFHSKMIYKGWGAFELNIFLLGFVGIILGSWDWGIGELASGGNYNRVGTEGILFLNDWSLILTWLSIFAWIGFMAQLLIRFPIMRENLIWMYIGMIAVQIGFIGAHASKPDAGFFQSFTNPGVILTNMIFAFLTIFVVHRAVVETRDVHVIERHAHPDPRVVEIAWKDHSLRLWSLGLGIWMVLVNIFSWSGANAVSLRPEDAEVSVFEFPWLYLVCNIVSVFLLIHIIWYPQFMLGAAGDRIQSVRAREVSGDFNIIPTAKKQGICPICKEETPTIQHPSGKVTVLCQQYQCKGMGKPGSVCQECDMTLPTRLECVKCKSNTTISSHFIRQDAW
jgi:hypothetical protein|tara:strand:- start:452 stop:1582 length:1131 start_codon:yes stop_codon:yes gene_type:complete